MPSLIFIYFTNSLKLPNYFPAGFYNLTVIATNSDGYSFKNFSKDIEFVKNTNGYYIVTDKPIYKASETVNYRLVGIDGMLKPLQKTVSIFIMVKN